MDTYGAVIPLFPRYLEWESLWGYKLATLLAFDLFYRDYLGALQEQYYPYGQDVLQ